MARLSQLKVFFFGIFLVEHNLSFLIHITSLCFVNRCFLTTRLLNRLHVDGKTTAIIKHIAASSINSAAERAQQS